MDDQTSGDIEDERQKLQHDIQRIQDTLYDDSYSEYDSNSESECLEIDLEPPERNPSATDDDTRTRSSIGATSASQSTQVSEGIDYQQEQELFDEEDGVTELPINTETTLALNRAYQEVLVDLLKQIEESLEENRQKQENFEKAFVGHRERAVQSNPFKIFQRQFSIPFIKDPMGGIPPPNEDVMIKKQMKEHKQDLIPNREWLKRDRRKMSDAVAEDALQHLLQPLMSKLELEQEKLEKCSKSEEIDVISTRIDAIEEEIAVRRATSREDLLRNVDPTKVDWMKISNLAYDGRKTFEECQMMWLNMLNPTVNRDKWEPAEDVQLTQLAKQFKEKDWVSIAALLQTGRTPYMCLRRYQTELNVANTRVPWTEEEDKKLLEIVDNTRISGQRLIWSKVSGYMENRSGTMCFQRFHQIDPNMRRGPWTKEEDLSLFTAVNLVGIKSWTRLSDFVPGRTSVQCRDRWLNCLDPRLRIGNWTYEEDKELLKAAQELGTKSWKKIADRLTGRSENMVLQRYRRLENFRMRSQWFDGLPESTRRGLLGYHLSQEEQKKMEALSWHNFQLELCVHRDDYKKQEHDRAQGDLVVPRPPPMFGYTTNARKRVVENRLKLQDMIMRHIQSIQKSNNLSTEVENMDPKTQEELATRIQTAAMGTISVRKMIEISRDMKTGVKSLTPPKVPQPQRKRAAYNFFAMRKKRKQEEELRLATQAIFKPKRRMKKGRPRKFFTRSRILPEEDKRNIKVKSLNLVMKALDIDVKKMLANAQEQKNSSPGSTATQSKSSSTSTSTLTSTSTSTSTSSTSSSRKASRRSSNCKSSTKEDRAIPTAKEPMADYDMLRSLSQREVQRSEGLSMGDDPEQTAMEAHFEERVREKLDDREQAKGRTIKKLSELIKMKQLSTDSGETRTRKEESVGIADQNSPRKKFPMFDKKSLKPDSHASQSASTSTSSPASTSAQSSKPQVSSASTNTGTISSDSDKDEESSVHSLPLLPPNVTSMSAFKTLLLNRRKHVNNCGNLCNPFHSMSESLPSRQVLMNTTEVIRKRGRAPNTIPTLASPVVRGQEVVEIVANQSQPSLTKVKTESGQIQKSYKVVKCDNQTIHTLSHASPGVQIIKVTPVAQVKCSSGTNPAHNKLTIVPVQAQQKLSSSKSLVSIQDSHNGSAEFPIAIESPQKSSSSKTPISTHDSSTKTSLTIKGQQRVPTRKAILSTSILPSKTLLAVPNLQKVPAETLVSIPAQQKAPTKTLTIKPQERGPSTTLIAIQGQQKPPAKALQTQQNRHATTSVATQQTTSANSVKTATSRETMSSAEVQIEAKERKTSTSVASHNMIENCRELKKIRETDEYKLLRARFHSIFMWPALLSTVQPAFDRTEFHEKAHTVGREEEEWRPATKKPRMYACTKKTWCKKLAKKMNKKAEEFNEEGSVKKRPGRPKGTLTKSKLYATLPESTRCLRTRPAKETIESSPKKRRVSVKGLRESMRETMNSMETGESYTQASEDLVEISSSPEEPIQLKDKSEGIRVSTFSIVTSSKADTTVEDPPQPSEESASLSRSPNRRSSFSPVSTTSLNVSMTSIGGSDDVLPCPESKENESLDLQEHSDNASPQETGSETSLTKFTALRDVDLKVKCSPVKQTSSIPKSTRERKSLVSPSSPEDSTEMPTSKTAKRNRRRSLPSSPKDRNVAARSKSADVSLNKSEDNICAVEANGRKEERVESEGISNKVKSSHGNLKKSPAKQKKQIADVQQEALEAERQKLIAKLKGLQSDKTIANKSNEILPSPTKEKVGKITPRKRGRKSKDSEEYKAKKRKSSITKSIDPEDVSQIADENDTAGEAARTAASSLTATTAASTVPVSSKLSTASLTMVSSAEDISSASIVSSTASATAVVSNVTLPLTIPGQMGNQIPQTPVLEGSTLQSQISNLGTNTQILPQMPLLTGTPLIPTPSGSPVSLPAQSHQLNGQSVSGPSQIPSLGGNALTGQPQIPLTVGNTPVAQNPLIGALPTLGLPPTGNPLAAGVGALPMILTYVPGPDGLAHPVLQAVPLHVLQNLKPLPMSPSVNSNDSGESCGPKSGQTDLKNTETVARVTESVPNDTETVPKGTRTVP